MTQKITIAFGDGIGPEIMDSTLAILKEAEAKLYFDTIEVGQKIYEKGFNNDKIDFELTVRSKTAPSLLPEDQSQNGIKKSYTITSTNNYLGNTPQEADNMGITKNIIIGKNPKPRLKTLNKQDFPFLRYLKNETVINSSASTIDFVGYDSGFADYDLVSYTGDTINNLIAKTRKNRLSYRNPKLNAKI